MKTPPDKTIAFTFGSHPTPSLAERWSVTMTFPPGSTEATAVAVSAVDGNGAKIASGEFEIAGLRIPIADGAGSVPFGDFVRGVHETSLWMHRPGMDPVPGGLTFQ